MATQVVGKKNSMAYRNKQGDGKHLTLIAAGNAAGGHIHPTLIHASATPGTVVAEGFPNLRVVKTKSGWINTIVWRVWVRDFVMQTGGNNVLISDWHDTRADLVAAEYLRQTGVKLIMLPPNATHLLQPADLSYFSLFKRSLAKSLSDYDASTDEDGTLTLTVRTWTTATISPHLYRAFLEALNFHPNTKTKTMENGWTSGFRAAGVHPFDRSAVTAEQLAKGQLWRGSGSEDAAVETLMSLASPAAHPPTPPPEPVTAEARGDAARKKLPVPVLSVQERLAEYKKRHDMKLRTTCEMTDLQVITVALCADELRYSRQLAKEADAETRKKQREAAAAERRELAERKREETAARKAAAPAAMAARKAKGLPAHPRFRLSFQLPGDLPAAQRGRFEGVKRVAARIGGERVDFTLLVADEDGDVAMVDASSTEHTA